MSTPTHEDLVCIETVAGHFIDADHCRFFIHTGIGPYCVSTVGDWHPRAAADDDPPMAIGYRRLFETYVFDKRREEDRWTEIDAAPANNRIQDKHNHDEMAKKYQALYAKELH